ncbi:hypothetical protein IscW_ISCW020897, partial [Ixodes scapularis]
VLRSRASTVHAHARTTGLRPYYFHIARTDFTRVQARTCGGGAAFNEGTHLPFSLIISPLRARWKLRCRRRLRPERVQAPSARTLDSPASATRTATTLAAACPAVLRMRAGKPTPRGLAPPSRGWEKRELPRDAAAGGWWTVSGVNSGLITGHGGCLPRRCRWCHAWMSAFAWAAERASGLVRGGAFAACFASEGARDDVGGG